MFNGQGRGNKHPPPFSCKHTRVLQGSLTRLDPAELGQVVVIPVRVNVNLKAVTVEDLKSRRKARTSSPRPSPPLLPHTGPRRPRLQMN